MAFEIKGDLRVCRTAITKRTDEGLVSETLTGDRLIDRHESHWASFDGGASDRSIELPDATTLPEGWQQIVHNTGGTNNLEVREFNSTSHTGTILETIGVGSPACEFTLLDGSTAAGVWYVNCLESPDDLVAVKFCAMFSTTDFTAAVGGYRSISPTEVSGLGASTHGRGTSPIYILQEDVSGDYDRVIADRERMNTSGDLTIRVADGCEFNGRVCFV